MTLNEDKIKLLIIRWSLVRAQVGPQKMPQRKLGLFFIE